MSVEIYDEYALALDQMLPALESSYERMKQFYSLNKKFDYSEALINRLRAFYCTQSKIKNFLDKKIAQAGSDFFVENVIFFLKLFNDLENLGFQIKSEQCIQRKRNAIRPDISLWDGSELIAIIECKTQLGWHRDNWELHFTNRENDLKKEFPNVEMFLFVMSGCNWSGFGDDPRVGKQFFCLLNNNIWPTDISSLINLDLIENRIEKLFEQIKNLRH
jgi:hypothetical protein